MTDIVLLEHTAPESEADIPVSACDLNRDSFDLKSHLINDTVCSAGDWLVVNKIKSWGVLDLMVVDGGREVRSSFDKFSRSEIVDLFKVCICGIDVLKAMSAKKIFVGANINHGFKGQRNAFLRLHLHILGLTKSDFDKMKSVKLGELEREKKGIRDLILDPLMEQFKCKLTDDFAGILGGVHKYEFGLRFNLNKLDAEGLTDAISVIDARIAKKFPELSYSFCIVIEGERAHLNISPRSVYGKGVLESEGILLKRDKYLDFNEEELAHRLDFFNRIFFSLRSKFSNVTEGRIINNGGQNDR